MPPLANVPVDPSRVVFSAGSEIYVGAHGAAEAALARLGLLDEQIQLNPNVEIRQAMGGYPRVPVAESVTSYGLQLTAGVREISKEPLLYAFGLEETDITATAGSDVVVAAAAGDAVTFDATTGVAVLPHPVKSGSGGVALNTAADGTGTALVEGTDYYTLERDPEGRTLLSIIGGGAITAGDTVYAAYTYVQATQEEYDVGSKAVPVYRTIKLVENLTDGAKLEAIIWKARVGINNAIAFNNATDPSTLPLTFNAIWDTTKSKLFTVRRVYP